MADETEGQTNVGKLLIGGAGAVACLALALNVICRVTPARIADAHFIMPTGRADDHALYRINETFAFSVDRRGVSVVQVEPGPVPFRPLCGVHQATNVVVSAVEFRKGPWIYRGKPALDGADILNVETGETIEVEDPDADVRGLRSQLVFVGTNMTGSSYPNPEDLRGYGTHQLSFESEWELSYRRIAAEYDRMDTINSSCVTMNKSAFGAIALLLGLATLWYGRGWAMRVSK